MDSRRIGPVQPESLDGVLIREGSMQTTSGRPNQAVDQEMNPASQQPSKASARAALAGFIVFCGAGAPTWFAL
jgi:hypothetical protein